MKTVEWQTEGPRVLAWLRSELPRRGSKHGIWTDCRAAMELPIGVDGVRQWVTHQSGQWPELLRLLGSALPGGAPAMDRPMPPGAGPRTLVDFVRDKKRADCRVCQLPADAIAQLRQARDKDIPRRHQLEWLACDYGLRLDEAELAAHVNGRHDR